MWNVAFPLLILCLLSGPTQQAPPADAQVIKALHGHNQALIDQTDDLLKLSKAYLEIDNFELLYSAESLIGPAQRALALSQALIVLHRLATRMQCASDYKQVKDTIAEEVGDVLKYLEVDLDAVNNVLAHTKSPTVVGEANRLRDRLHALGRDLRPLLTRVA